MMALTQFTDAEVQAGGLEALTEAILEVRWLLSVTDGFFLRPRSLALCWQRSQVCAEHAHAWVIMPCSNRMGG